ncbi:MAG: class I SAM-dependent methyltransferase [Myxococcales bacterium]|nr:class I SAM-dependent methyltransferase [Myxococcales bacterium]
MSNAPAAPPLSRTLTRQDLDMPEVRRHARDLSHLTRRLWLRGIPVAQNGVLRRRLRIRWNKLWEYARSLAVGGFTPELNVLDIGGAGTIPIFWLARLGCRVTSCDIDERLCHHTRQVARRFSWPIECRPLDLSREDPPPEWNGRFARAISFCVIEHVPRERRHRLLAAVATTLAPGGQLHLTFDFGREAPEPGALRTADEVLALARSSGLSFLGREGFEDTGERFVLDRRHPGRSYTFGSLFLHKPSAATV